jgi:hypothetical protein
VLATHRDGSDRVENGALGVQTMCQAQVRENVSVRIRTKPM